MPTRSLAWSRALAFAVLLAVAAPATPASAVPLIRRFGGPEGFGTDVLNRNDDNSTGAIDLTGAFPGGLRFYGGPYTQVWVNNNGNLTFNGPLGQYTSNAFPVASRPMIAPFWADVDTRVSMGLSDPNENLVYYHLEPGRLVVTWYLVGYYGLHNEHRDSFQLILTNANGCGSGDFDVEFRYERCEWYTGTASGDANGDGQCEATETGCVAAQAGFDAGNLTDYVAIPTSMTTSITNTLCNMTNVPGESPGIWQFSVRAGGVTCRADAVCAVPNMLGACSVGRTQCVMDMAQCEAVVMPTMEICDNVDNDCDGSVDEGNGLCGPSEACVLGNCVMRCFEGNCAVNYTCDPVSGGCVETACLGRMCPAGQRCIGVASGTDAGIPQVDASMDDAGSDAASVDADLDASGDGGASDAGDVGGYLCVDACLGIVCPHGQTCLSGACVDPCQSVHCDSTRICRDGVCVGRCPCTPCEGGDTCLADGSCLARGCDIVTCDPGQFCDLGQCHDACDGVVCPHGLTCQTGNCQFPVPVDAGPPMPDAGAVDGGARDASISGMDMGAGDMGTHGPPPPDTGSNCGCRTGASSSRLAIVALGVLFAVARRRRRS